MNNRICLLGFSLCILSILNSCSYDKVLTGTYYLKHDNSVEEYFIVKPDSTYIQFLIIDSTIVRNDDVYIRNEHQNENDYIFKNYQNGFEPPYESHPSNQSRYDLHGTFTATIAGKRKIIIEYNMDIYLTKITQSYDTSYILNFIELNNK